MADNFVVRFYRETRSELTKVVWPTRREAQRLTLIVIAITVTMSILLGGIDWIFAKLFELIIRR